MPTTTQQLPQQPIIVVTVTPPFNPLKDMVASGQEFAKLVAAIPGPVYRIVDISRWDMKFSDLVNVLDKDMRRGQGYDPRVHTIIVSSSAIAALGAKATAQDQYIGQETPMFASLDEALTYVRGELARGK